MARDPDRPRSGATAGLVVHAVVYLAVNAMAVAAWILLFDGDPGHLAEDLTDLGAARDDGFWPIYLIVFWGLALAIHAGVVLATAPARWRAARARRRSRNRVHDSMVDLVGGTVLERPTLAGIRIVDGDRAAARARRRASRGRGPRPAADPSTGESHTVGQPGATRSWVAVLFTDVVRSTPLNEALGDDEWAALLARHRHSVRECLAQHGGSEVGTQGDGFLLRFASPDDAASCALDLQRQCARDRRKSGHPLHIRIGGHAGEVVHDDDDLIGRVVNLAARITDVAAADEILVTEPLADNLLVPLRDGARLEDRGLHPLRGFDRPRHLLALVPA